jgi:hypothetical protein
MVADICMVHQAVILALMHHPDSWLSSCCCCCCLWLAQLSLPDCCSSCTSPNFIISSFQRLLSTTGAQLECHLAAAACYHQLVPGYRLCGERQLKDYVNSTLFDILGTDIDADESRVSYKKDRRTHFTGTKADVCWFHQHATWVVTSKGAACCGLLGQACHQSRA